MLFLWHLRNFRLWFRLHRRQHCLYLLFGLSVALLYEVPDRIHDNVVNRLPIVALIPPRFADPAYRLPLGSRKTNRGSLGIFWHVFLSWAHGSRFSIDCIVALLHYHVIVQ